MKNKVEVKNAKPVKGTTFTQKEFILMKNLIENGYLRSDIVRITGRSIGTVRSVEKAETFEEYTENHKKAWELQKARYEANQFYQFKKGENELPFGEPEVPQMDVHDYQLLALKNILEEVKKISTYLLSKEV